MATSTRTPKSTNREKTAAIRPARKSKPPAKIESAESGASTLDFPPPEPEPFPAPALAPSPSGPRRAVFIDVENTSSEADLNRVLDELKIEHLGSTTELTAIGNWRVVGQGLGRSLAARGAHLVHSAPAVRVSDWSDLWIAVHAGIWLGRARAGDVIEIVSHDRAFDAVGDAAIRLGVTFRRITYRPQAGAADREATAPGTAQAAGRRRDRRGRRPAPPTATSARNAQRPPAQPRAVQSVPALPSENPSAGSATGEPLSASQDQIQLVIARLTAADPAAGVNLDRLTVALKAAGFQRPPGSPRLMTRLRKMRDVEVLPNGRVRIAGDVVASHSAAVVSSTPIQSDESSTDGVDAGPVAESNGEAAPQGTAPKRRSRRRGGRRRHGPGRPPETAPVAPAS